MKTVQKTYAELLTLVQFINGSVSGGQTIGEKKLAVFGKKIQPHLDEYNERLEDIRLNNASVDKDGNLILNEKGGYNYTPEASKKINAELKELLNEEFTFNVVPVYNPSGLTQYSFLKDWVDGVEFEEEEEIEL